MKAPGEEIYGKSTHGTLTKSTVSGLQRCRWQYGSIFVLLAVVAPKSTKSHEILRKFELVELQGHQGHRYWRQSKAHMQLPISH